MTANRGPCNSAESRGVAGTGEQESRGPGEQGSERVGSSRMTAAPGAHLVRSSVRWANARRPRSAGSACARSPRYRNGRAGERENRRAGESRLPARQGRTVRILCNRLFRGRTPADCARRGLPAPEAHVIGAAEQESGRIGTNTPAPAIPSSPALLLLSTPARLFHRGPGTVPFQRDRGMSDLAAESLPQGRAALKRASIGLYRWEGASSRNKRATTGRPKTALSRGRKWVY
jgi:hypothetical protein